MLIKTTTGIELGGAVSAPSASQAVPYFASGSLVLVDFRFTCALNPGTYFLNAGVLGSTDKEESFLHRVLDACMFKVVSFTGDLSTGTVDFNGIPEIMVVADMSGREFASL